MRLLIVSATKFELAPLNHFLGQHFQLNEEGFVSKEGLEIRLLYTGVGMMHTAYAMGKTLGQTPYDLVINAGIAGAFPERGLSIGDVVNVGTERFGDLGAEQADGSFADVHEMELIAADQFPFQNGRLVNPGAENQSFLPLAHGLTINKVHGHAKSIENIRAKYDVDIETMEGAAFFFACLQEQQAFLEIRAISNHVESRNKDNWDIPLSINNLNTTLLQMVESFL